MTPTRRRFLVGLAAAGCAGPTRSRARPGRTSDPSTRPPADLDPTAAAAAVPPGPEPTGPWNPPGWIDDRRFGCGIQTGDPQADSVIASVRVDARSVRIRYARFGRSGWIEEEPVDGVVMDGTLQVELGGLLPDHSYAVVAYVGGRRSREARVRTAPAPGSLRPVRFAASCCFGNLGAPFRSAGRVSAEALDFVVLLGDTIYAGPELGNWDPHWTAALSTPGLRELLLSTSVVATWDDHEVLNDWTWDQVGDAAWDALASYRRALPQRLGPGGTGVWRRLAWGALLDVFVLDARGERTATDCLSSDQLEWLLDGLETSTARWKLVVNSVPLTDLTGLWPDAETTAWGPFPAQRARILDALRGRTDVLVITGDVHFGGIARMGKLGTADQDSLEILCGPAGSRVSIPVEGYDASQYDPLVLEWNTVVFDVDPDQVRVTFEGDDGPIAERVLR